MPNVAMQAVDEKSLFNLDPRTKLLLTLTANVPAFSADKWYVLALTAAIPLSLLLFKKRYFSTFIYAAIYAFSLFIDVFVIDSATGAWGLLAAMFSGVFCRMMPGILMGYFLLSTTTVSEIVAALERIHMPKQIIIPISVMFRFFPTIKEESLAISDAMKMRGVGIGKTRGGLISLMEYRMIPLFISSVKIGDELSSAALTRGLGSPVKRTNICEIGFGVMDAVYLIIAAVTIVLFFAKGGGMR